MRQGRRRRGIRRRGGHGVSGVALAAGVVGCGALLAATVLPGVAPTVDPVPAWGASWSAGATGADAMGAAAVAERLAVATGLGGLLAGLGLFTLLLLLVGGRERRRPALAVRFALGADLRRLATHLLARDGRRLGAMAAVGLGVGMAVALLLQATWPGAGIPGAAPAGGIAAGLVAGAAAGLLALALVSVTGLLSPLPGLADATPDVLRRGHGVTDDPRAGTVRRGAATLQGGLAFALALTGLALVQGTMELDGPAPGTMEGSIDGNAAGAGGPLLARYAVSDPGQPVGGGVGVPTLLASPGAWLGRGVRDLVTVECGACVRGGLYLPVYGVDSTVHAVEPAVLGALGVEVLEGRGLSPGDTARSEPVGVVNRAFRSHFQDGDPVGRRIRLSGSGDRWVRVVGVVGDPDFLAPGAPGAGSPVLWMPLAQHPAAEVEGVVGTGADPVAGTPLGPVGLRPVTDSRALTEVRRAALAPVVWSGRLLLVGGALALVLALLSAAEVARVEARGRARAAAVRIAVGAPPWRPAWAILSRALKGAALGVLAGVAVAWSLERALGAGGRLPPGLRPALAAAVLLVTAAAALPRIRDLFRLDPAVLLREE